MDCICCNREVVSYTTVVGRDLKTGREIEEERQETEIETYNFSLDGKIVQAPCHPRCVAECSPGTEAIRLFLLSEEPAPPEEAAPALEALPAPEPTIEEAPEPAPAPEPAALETVTSPPAEAEEERTTEDSFFSRKTKSRKK